MKKITVFILLLSSKFAVAQVVQPVIDSASFVISSSILGEQCKALVYLPAGYKTSTDKYPVIYVLDGEYNFTFTSEAVTILTSNEKMPPSIVIGITTNNRNRDFTTTGDKNWQPPQEMPSAGGADKFLNYLEKELIPTVEKKYRTAPFRVIIGHSLGGLLAMHAFVTKPTLFQATIGLESSLWWNDGAVGNETINFLNAHPSYKGKLFIARIKLPKEYWFPINVTLVDFFEKKRPAGLEYTYMELDKEEHATMVFPATYFGLRDIFSDYFFVLDEKANEKSVMEYYTALSSKYGYTVKIPQQMYAFLWDMAEHEKRYADAIKFGELRIKNYPDSYRAYLNLGTSYMEMDNKEMAIKMLTKSLELHPGDASIKQQLERLGKK